MNSSYLYLLPFLAVLCAAQCSQPAPEKPGAAQAASVATPQPDLSTLSKATFASGCFWCVEAEFESIRGVAEAISGYAGGTEDNPTYEQVSSGRTGHAEAVEVYYDSSVVDYPTLLRVFFTGQDPTQVDGQGPDHGRQYRSIVFYRNAAEKMAAEQYIAQLNSSGQYKKPVATEVVPFTKFYEAEEYHQDFVRRNPKQQYVVFESIPRVKRMQKQLPELLKPERTLVGN
jgi:peptide-methionine (S)-S-oxide reductase